MGKDLEALKREVGELSERSRLLSSYIRDKADRLLVVMGSKPLDASGLDDRTLIALDPIGTIADSFAQVLAHVHDVNAKLRAPRRAGSEPAFKAGAKQPALIA